MRVIGTAGHVDHGKSTLVAALTGTHPDRLKEERARAMTIDLGFAWFDLPNGEPVGVVDVPGHRDFIENMLAGVGGIDAALFVVAADEGVMPQTREHLAILDLLQIPGGVVALTKTDLAESEEWVALVAAEVRQAVRGTVLEAAPIIPLSARQGTGLDDLRQALAETLAAAPARPDLGRPRLSIDRSFSISGFGTVVTGTLVDGALNVGDEVEILPSGIRARVRGLQSHKHDLSRAVPGSRAAVNLAGIDAGLVRRGDLLTRPGLFQPTALVDVRYRHLPDAGAPLKHNAEVKLFVGAAEVMALARLLSHEALPPGESGWLQLALAEPLPLARGDRFILRRPSPGATVGGGQIVDPHPGRRHKRRDAGLLARLETALQGTPEEILLQALESLGPAPLSAAIQKSGLETRAAQTTAEALAGAGQIIHLDETPGFGRLVVSAADWGRVAAEAQAALADFHAAQPLRGGMSREALKSRLRLPAKVFAAVLARAASLGLVEESGPEVRLPGHAIRYSPEQQARVDALVAACRQAPYNTPLVRDAQAQVGEAVFAALVEQGRIVQLNEDVFFLRETYAEMVARVVERLGGGARLTVAQVRDMFNASRKYALALMEHLDARGITVRLGDDRALKKQ